MAATTKHRLASLSSALTLAICHSAASAQSGTAQDAIEEITVTAQRRAENIEDVPISVTSVSAELIANVSLRSLDKIETVTPGLTFNTGFGYAQNYIRGVGSNTVNAGLEAAVASYYDGSYAPRAFGVLGDLLDLQSIQVLKGPQGTLYGRNASGGAVIVTTAEPTSDFEGHVALEVGRFDHRLVEGVLNAPLSETVSVRFAARFTDDEGYVHNRFDGRNLGDVRKHTVRGKLAVRPSDDFSAILTVEHSNRRSEPQPLAERLDPPACLGCALAPGVATPNSDFYDADIDVTEDVTVETLSLNLRLRGAFAGLDWESITGYRDIDGDGPTDLDQTRLNLFRYEGIQGGETFTQDLQLSTQSDGPWNGIIGLSYFHDKGHFDAHVSGLAFAALAPITSEMPISLNTVRTDSIAAFTEVTFEPVDGLKLTAGGRYTYDERDIETRNNLAAVLAFTEGVGPSTIDDDVNFDSFTPRFVISYDTGPLNFYASYNRGFKAGGYSTPMFLLSSVKPEEIDSYELGAKYASADHRLRVSLATFYYKYDELQVQVADLDAGGAAIQNAASATGKGAGLEAQYELSKRLSVFGGASYLDAKYDEYENASVAVLTPTGLTDGVMDLSDTRLSRAPRFTAFLGAEASIALGDWQAALNGVVRHSSKYTFTPGGGGPLIFAVQPKYTIANVTADIGPADERYQIGMYVDNLTDEKYYAFRNQLAPFGAFDTVAAPRTYGVRARYKF